MELYEAKRLIRDGESDFVEFKRKLNHPEKVIREVVAFANSQGGHLFIGVDDDRTIVGSKHAEDEDFLMQQSMKELCRPPVKYVASKFKINEKRSLLHYHIQAGDKKPHYAFEKKQHRYGKAFVRVGDRTVQASPEIRKILKFKNEPYDTHFSYGPNEQLIFKHLREHDHITLSTFREVSGLAYKEASDILVRMVMTNALKIIPKEAADWYVEAE
ncbi:MAG: ATP-binding protein [Cyclobacteriaceae bacterium]